ncbi:MAG: hypothetical protein M1840_009076 [Geoglossum simile]|nr:MAG: hypothetical protein M1840_009076 [Geoglossum simile]
MDPLAKSIFKLGGFHKICSFHGPLHLKQPPVTDSPGVSGTWQNSDNGFEKDGFFSTGKLQTPSNVTRIARAITPYHDDPGTGTAKNQIVYYQAGVGTGNSIWDKVAGGTTGEGLSEHIREAYAFLANNYQAPDSEHEGDEIFLIGFSRGAFTARSIGGLIGQIGILTKLGMEHFYHIFKDYEKSWDRDWESDYMKRWPDRPFDHPVNIRTKNEYAAKLEQLKQTRVKGVRIKAVAVWDTVGSLGIPKVSWLEKFPGFSQANKEYSFHDTTLSDIIDNAFHALALDEKRPPFSPAVWERPDNVKTNLIQVWFPGAHSSVGGGNDDQGIADVTLAWMMNQLKGMITFDDKYLEFQYALTKKWQIAHYTKEREWALGLIPNSSSGIMSLAGGETRNPGRYMRIDPDTHASIAPLQNTNEYIHASARVRLGLRDSKGIDDKGTPYKCAALDGWKISGIDDDGDGVVDRGVSGAGVEWRYNKAGQNKTLAEAPLGDMEKELLWHFGNMAEKVMKVKPDGKFVVHAT